MSTRPLLTSWHRHLVHVANESFFFSVMDIVTIFMMDTEQMNSVKIPDNLKKLLSNKGVLCYTIDINHYTSNR